MREGTLFLKYLDLIKNNEITVKSKQIAVPIISINESLLMI